MRMRAVPAIAAAIIALAAMPAAASAKEKLKLDFQKDCPEFTCTGTLLERSGTPIRASFVSTTLTPLWFEAGVLGYTAVETLSQGGSEFTMNLVGTMDYNAEPDATEVLGSVVSGSWDGRPLSGALVQGSAERVFGSTLRGSLLITPQGKR
jgi:hypothetical protein